VVIPLSKRYPLLSIVIMLGCSLLLCGCHASTTDAVHANQNVEQTVQFSLQCESYPNTKMNGAVIKYDDGTGTVIASFGIDDGDVRGLCFDFPPGTYINNVNYSYRGKYGNNLVLPRSFVDVSNQEDGFRRVAIARNNPFLLEGMESYCGGQGYLCIDFSFTDEYDGQGLFAAICQDEEEDDARFTLG
jgi:hypothetical protein